MATIFLGMSLLRPAGVSLKKIVGNKIERLSWLTVDLAMRLLSLMSGDGRFQTLTKLLPFVDF